MKMKNLAKGTFLSETPVYYRANKNNATHYIYIMKEYTRDNTIIFQTRSCIHMSIAGYNAQKRSMVYNIEQIKNNATHKKEYTKDITVIVSNMFTYIDVKSRLHMFI